MKVKTQVKAGLLNNNVGFGAVSAGTVVANAANIGVVSVA